MAEANAKGMLAQHDVTKRSAAKRQICGVNGSEETISNISRSL